MPKLPRFSKYFLLWIGASGILLASSAAESQSYEAETVIALEGDPAPSGGFFSGFSGVVLNDSGDLAFRAVTSAGATGPPFSFGIFSQSVDGAMRVIAQDGLAVPGMIGIETLSFPGIATEARSLNSAGDIVFYSGIQPIVPGPASQGYFLDAGGVQTEILRSGDLAPNSVGGTLSPLSVPSITDSGRIIFSANVVGGSAAGGIFVYEGGAISPIVLTGEASPETVAYESIGDVTINVSGDVVFRASLANGVLGLFRIVEGVHSTVALIGDVMPDSDLSSIYSFGESVLPQFAVSMNGAGDVAFGALSNNGVTGGAARAYEGAYVREISGVLRSAAVAGEFALGSGDGHYDFGPITVGNAFPGLVLSVLPRIGDNGGVVFGAPFVGPSVGLSQAGLFVDSGGNDEMILRTGDPAPALSGSTIASLGVTSGVAPDERIIGVATNSRNDVAFVAVLAGQTSGRGLFYLPEPEMGTMLSMGVLGLMFIGHSLRGGKYPCGRCSQLSVIFSFLKSTLNQDESGGFY